MNLPKNLPGSDYMNVARFEKDFVMANQLPASCPIVNNNLVSFPVQCDMLNDM